MFFFFLGQLLPFRRLVNNIQNTQFYRHSTQQARNENVECCGRVHKKFHDAALAVFIFTECLYKLMG